MTWWPTWATWWATAAVPTRRWSCCAPSSRSTCGATTTASAAAWTDTTNFNPAAADGGQLDAERAERPQPGLAARAALRAGARRGLPGRAVGAWLAGSMKTSISPRQWTPATCWRPPAVELTFFGHTHVQCAYARPHEVSGRLVPERMNTASRMQISRLKLMPLKNYLVNPGSVGQPRDRDRRAAFAVYDSVEREILFYRVPYDIAGAQERILQAGLPQDAGQRGWKKAARPPRESSSTFPQPTFAPHALRYTPTYVLWKNRRIVWRRARRGGRR